MQITELELADVLELKELQSLMDNLFAVTGIGTGITDTKGNIVIKTGRQDICTRFHRVNPRTLKNCDESSLIISRDLKLGEFRIRKCKNNLWDIVTPIIVNKKHVGNVFLGHFFFEDEVPDYNLFASQAEKYGFNKDEYLAAFHRVPRLNREKVKDIVAVYARLAEIISTLGYTNLMAAKALTEQQTVKEALDKTKDELEANVRARTAELERAREELQIRATVLDKSTEAIFLADLNNCFLHANEAACSLFGYSKEEFTGMSEMLLLAPQEMPYTENNIKTLDETGELNIEAYAQRKDRSFFTAELHVHTVQIEGKKYTISSFRDITRRKEAAEATRKSEVLFRSIFESSPIGIELYNAAGQLITVNQATLDIFGITGGYEVIGFQLFNDPNIPSKVKAGLRNFEQVKFEIPFDFDKVKAANLYQTSRSGTIYLDIVATPLKLTNTTVSSGYLVHIQDITKHKLALEKIKQDELQLENIFDALTEAVTLFDIKGNIVKANPISQQISGLEPEKLIGHHYDYPGIKPKPTRPDGSEIPFKELPLFKTLQSKKAMRNTEIRQVWPNGSIKWFLTNDLPILNESNEITGVVNTATDITEQKRLTDEIELFTKRLIDVQEEERKRISRDLHDEIAQKLSLSLLELDALISKEKKLSPEAARALERIRAITNETMLEVRRFSHELRPSVLEHFGIAEALEMIIDEMNLKSKTQVTIKVTGLEERLPEEVEIALFRIAQEALNNIRKHSGATKARVSLTFANNKVRLSVSDNGNGFDINKISEKTNVKGLGLVGMKERA